MVTERDPLVDGDTRMQKSVAALSRELDTIRTGRASPALVERLLIDYYGTPTPMNQLASISVPEARVLMIQPWDKQALAGVERAILKSDLALVPNNDGAVIRINIPTLTEERRRELVRLVGRKIEDAHVAVRNVRRDALAQLRDMQKSKELSQDEARRAQAELQELTDAYIHNMDELGEAKVAEVMEV